MDFPLDNQDDGWYYTKRARTIEEWRHMARTVWATNYDFSKPAVLKKKVKRISGHEILFGYKSPGIPGRERPLIDTCDVKQRIRRKRPPRTIKPHVWHPQKIQTQRCQENDWQVFVKTPLSTTLCLQLHHSISVQDLKTIIDDKLGIAIEKQVLFIGPLKMCNLLSLGDHGVKDQSNIVLEILPGLLGGADKPVEQGANPGAAAKESTDVSQSDQRVPISDNDIQDIIDIFSLTSLEDDGVYARLDLTDKDINNAKLKATTPEGQAKAVLNYWCKTRAEDATRDAMITAMKQCPNCRASLKKLEKRWNPSPEPDQRVPISDNDIQDIIDIFSLASLEDAGVYVRLGLTDKDINNAKLKATTPEGQARAVLNYWCKTRAEDATRDAMIAAMKQCPNCRASLKELEKRWNTSPGTETKFDVESCKKELISYYKRRMGQVHLLPWFDEEAKNMDDIYVSLELEKKTKGRNERSCMLEKNEDLVTIKTAQNVSATRVVVKGVAGSGDDVMEEDTKFSKIPSLILMEIWVSWSLQTSMKSNFCTNWCIPRIYTSFSSSKDEPGA